MNRWQTYRIIIFSSLICCTLCVCLLLYYMQCLVDYKIILQKEMHFSTHHEKQVNDVLEKYIEVHEMKSRFPKTYSSEDLYSWAPVDIQYNPAHWVGENGKAVIIGEEESELKERMYEINKFNLLASDRIALNRSLPDVRVEGCKHKSYPELLPKTSVIIVFHNEAWSTLLRTIHSVIRMSPNPLIEEIILVDDASEREFLGKKLEDYVSHLPVPTFVLRTVNRSGLIRARILGSNKARGQVITFLDAHCECAEGWLEPLLSRIVEDRTRVVCPIIDVISDKTFEYITASDMTWGGFNWKLNFRWFRVPKRELNRRNNDRTLPTRTPTMAGGLFAIDRKYFEYLGKYDEGMQIWGGENLEFSFRTWMCGGTLEIAPCSHVGHVFRSKTPYTFPGGAGKVININNGRLVDVWLDEWKGFFYAIKGTTGSVDFGSTESRKQLRNDLKCNDFRWYLTNIYPESPFPLKYTTLGEIRNVLTNKCLDTFNRKSGSNLGMGSCHGKAGNQLFLYTDSKQILSNDNCIDATKIGKPVRLVRCHGMGGNQMWEYKRMTKNLMHMPSKLCLDKANDKKDKTLPVLRRCNGRKSQKWLLKSDFKWQLKHEIKSHF